jgi:hypothetical protein
MKNRYLLTGAFPLTLIFIGLAFSVFSSDYMNRTVKEMELAKPFYLKRTSAQWERQSRIIGTTKNTPKTFSIDICVAGSNPSRVLKTETFSDDLTVYETGWIGAGTYDLVFKSEGYVNMTSRNITIKPYSDCVINIVFGLTEYKR